MATNTAAVTGSRTIRVFADVAHAARLAVAFAGASISRLAVTGQMGIGRETEIGRRTGARC